MHVQLRDGVTGDGAAVSDLDCDIRAVARLHALLRQPQISELKRRVAQPVSERIERLAREIPVARSEGRVALWRVRQVVVVVERFLPYRLWPAHGELAAGIDVAEQ